MREFLNLVEGLTSLMERAKTVMNSTGRIISADPSVVERFWAWFGKSKVVDNEGRPLVVFHGTQADFKAFDPEKSNSNAATGVPTGSFVFTDNPEVAQSYYMAQASVARFANEALADEFYNLIKTGTFAEQMQFLHDNPQIREPEYHEGGNTMPVYLRIERPLVVNAKGDRWDDIIFKPRGWQREEIVTTNEIAQWGKDNGYDGAIIRNVKDVHKGTPHKATTYFVFSPGQIKSAISNTTFDGGSTAIDEDA